MKWIILAVLVGMVSCHEFGLEGANLAPGSSAVGVQDQGCADVMEDVNVCMDQLHDSEDAKAFNKRREELFKACVPNHPQQCSGQMAAMEACQAQIRADPALKKVREEGKGNVSKCYERYPNTRKTGGNRPSFPSAGGFGPGAAPGAPRQGPPPFGGMPPPPQGFGGPGAGGPAPGADQCAPTGEQMLCFKQRMDNDSNIISLGTRLREQERQCFTKPKLIECRPDNDELRQCLDQCAQTFMGQAGESMRQCVRKAGFDLPPLPPPSPPHMHGFGG